MILCSAVTLEGGEKLGSISGQVTFSNKKPIAYATVALIDLGDSSLVSAVHANSMGEFKFDGLKLQSYLIKISALGFKTNLWKVALNKAHTHITIENLNLRRNVSVLDEVVIHAKYDSSSAKETDDTLHIIEDEQQFDMGTIEIGMKRSKYKVEHVEFKKNEDAKSVIMNIPGVVEGEEGITSGGEKIVKILIDGQEYFGDNVQMALKNIPAEVIEQVDVIESKKLGGGKKINIVLKEKSKDVFFGDIQAGVGNKSRYQSKAVVNRFGNKIKLSAIADFNNINRTDIQFKKRKQLFEDPLESPINPKNGLIASDGIGLNLNFTPKKQQTLNVSYLYRKTDRDLLRNINRIFVTDDIPFDTFQENNVPVKTKKHELNTSYLHAFVFPNATSLNTKLTFNYQSEFQNNADILDLFSDELVLTKRVGNNKDEKRINYDASASLNYEIPLTKDKELKKTNFLTPHIKFSYINKESQGPFTRNIFTGLNTMSSSQNGENTLDNDEIKVSSGFQFSKSITDKQRLFVKTNVYYEKMNNERLILTDQVNFNTTTGDTTKHVVGELLQDQLTDTKGINGSIEYEKSLSSQSKVALAYTIERSIDLSERIRLNSQEGVFVIDTSESSSFKKDYSFHKPGISYHHDAGWALLDAGFKLQFSTLKGTNTLFDASLTKHFTNVSSFVNLIFYLDTARSQKIKLSFRSSVKEPSLQQLQPIAVFYNATRLYTGNPELDLEQYYSANINYYFLDKKSNSSLSTVLSAKMVDDKIYNELTIDSLFVRTTKPQNGVFQYEIEGMLQWKWNIKKNGPFVNGELSKSIDVRPFSFQSQLTGKDVITHEESLSLAIGNGQKKKPLNYALSTTIKNQKTIFPLTSDEDGVIEEAKIVHHTHGVTCSYTLLKDWTLGSTFSYLFFKATLEGNNQPQLARGLHLTKLDAYLQKSLLKNKAYMRLYVDDILNQNRGVNARTKGTFIEREEIATLQRYYMLSFLYYFSGKKKAS